MKQYLAFDIGGTFIKYALMGEDGSFLANGKVPTPTDTMEHLLEALEGIGRRYGGEYEEVAVSMPGGLTPPRGWPTPGAPWSTSGMPP